MATLVNFSEDLTLKFYIKRYDNNCIEYVQIWDSLASLPEIYAEPEIRNKLKVSAESKPDGFEFRNNGNLYDEDGHNIIGKIRFISDYDHNDDSDNDLISTSVFHTDIEGPFFGVLTELIASLYVLNV